MPTNVWNPLQPPDTQQASLLGSDIRGLKTDVQERMALISGSLANRWNPTFDANPTSWAGLLYFALDTNQIFQWNGNSWVDITANIGKISTVASIHLTGLASSIGATTLYTVPVGKGGIYRITANLISIATGGPGSITVGIQGSNGLGLNSKTLINAYNLGNVASNEGDGESTIFLADSAALQYFAQIGGTVGTFVYNLDLRVEYLG